MDRCFIRELVCKVESSSIDGGKPTNDAIRAVVVNMNVVFGMKLSYSVGQARMNHLKGHHQTFGWIINRPGVRWIPRPNIVLMIESLWEDIGRPFEYCYHFVMAISYAVTLYNFQKKPSALAYRFDTEPWEELKIIFGVPENEPYYPSDDEVYPEPGDLHEEIVV
ncbi:hypothetical protein Salat_1141800 [Sesamum alatum]|uniref:Uncharacterized protein n=1 Tax=Sesamum alatum TaxID=300844 RepID=A0AAE1YE33_9LAMI|nr:hypothetical protein Salat_1141800 [Sesamum alatum]